MSDIDYKNLRKSIREVSRKGSFPFPSYAQALFSQVLISRKPIQGVWEKPEVKERKKVPLMSEGPQVAGTEPLVATERKQVLQSLGRFVEEQGGEGINFPGGSIKVTADAKRLKESELEDSQAPTIIGEFSEKTTIVFFGEKPKDFNEENPNGDLLSKMISAMKLDEGSFCRVFIEKDNDIARGQWHHFVNQSKGKKSLIVVSLGAMATNIILGKKERLSKVHGKEFQIVLEKADGETFYQVFPVFHPDILQINPNMKRSAWMDLQKVMESLPK